MICLVVYPLIYNWKILSLRCWRVILFNLFDYLRGFFKKLYIRESHNIITVSLEKLKHLFTTRSHFNLFTSATNMVAAAMIMINSQRANRYSIAKQLIINLNFLAFLFGVFNILLIGANNPPIN